MTRKNLLVFVFVLMGQFLLAQEPAVRHLEELIVSDSQLKKFTSTQSVHTLNDSVLKKNNPLLTHLLNYTTGIYFKEYGLGMSSSASFRGTTGAQTAVIWNGININSQTLGQTDFNTLNASDFSSVSVRAGGGSVIYGSGAIGGSIHLNNDFEFKKTFENCFRLEYGSFSTSLVNYGVKAASDKVYTSVGFTRYDSKNDYTIPGTDKKNLNGAFYNTSLNANFGYKINEKNYLKYYGNFFSGERHFSLIFSTEIPTKYKNLNMRNLFEWAGFYGKWVSKFKVGFLSEEYNYFPDIKKTNFSFGKVETFLTKYDLSYDLAKNMKLNAIADYSQNKGNGSDITYENRRVGGLSIMLNHKIGWFLYEVTARRELTNVYKSPYLYSAGVQFKCTDYYSLRLNSSKNYRIPSFDDLYWIGSGNRDLKPETSQQYEIGNQFAFKYVTLELTGFYNDITDMIRWLPAGSVWRPMNIDKVEAYGLEGKLNARKNFGKHAVSIDGNYSYTISKNRETSKQLIYVPYHKATISLGYYYRKLSAYFQNMYVGEVFTRSDNNPKYNLKAYNVSNFGLDYDFGKKKIIKVGAKVQNLFQVKYEIVEGRFMPGRNFNLYINFKF
ncbi:TonB-dependent receptor [Flavobacterium sp. SM15]|uniref:TonB-dependent receptor plug domain-containing protein n=1 Tax=Flavobacterium sp. SM15 TaxID=2908005 RepID=UPI001EDC8E22|nr:TonB-dependent receptor [Flavobacterium sp. SM15]MCG2610470.1 TonB-dependent receptor [Flavobacterium sp. SM15]